MSAEQSNSQVASEQSINDTSASGTVASSSSASNGTASSSASVNANNTSSNTVDANDTSDLNNDGQDQQDQNSPAPANASQGGREVNKKVLYVGNIDQHVTEDMLIEVFKVTGNVLSIKIFPDKNVSHNPDI